MRSAATATVSAGCAVTTGRDMTSATVRSPGAGVRVSGMAPSLRLWPRRGVVRRGVIGCWGGGAVTARALREADGTLERLARRERCLRVAQLDAQRLVDRRAPLLV